MLKINKVLVVLMCVDALFDNQGGKNINLMMMSNEGSSFEKVHPQSERCCLETNQCGS